MTVIRKVLEWFDALSEPRRYHVTVSDADGNAICEVVEARDPAGAEAAARGMFLRATRSAYDDRDLRITCIRGEKG